MFRFLATFVAWSIVFASLSSQAGVPKTVTFVGYNVENWLPTDRQVDGKWVDRAEKPESEKAAVVRILARLQPDIIGLVEMGDRAQLADLQNRLRAAGIDLPHSEWLEALDTERHVALLSRFPITRRQSQDRVMFDVNGQPQGMHRGILDVTIAVTPQYELRVLGVHFKSRRPVPEFDQAALRLREAEALKARMDAILETSPDANVLIFGDFNDTKNEPPMKLLLADARKRGGFKDLWLKDSLGDRWTHFWRAADQYARLDYLIVSPGLWPDVIREKSGIDRSKEWGDASDHRAVFTVFTPRERIHP